MFLEIITPDKQLYSGEVKQVNLPGSDGSFEILENHAPIISTLAAGIVKLVDQSGGQSTFDIKGGVIEQSGNKIIILAE